MNKDIELRDKIVFKEYAPEKYSGGIRRFSDMDWQTLSLLVKEGFADETECQNNSPSIKEFLDMDNRFYTHARYEGYVVTDKRDDYRVTVDGISMEIPYHIMSDLVAFVNLLHWADEFHITNIGTSYYVRAWWD